MINKNSPWYIWFSVFAFIFLWSDTTRRLKLNRSYRSIWYRALGNAFKLWLCYIILPIPIIGFIIDRVFIRLSSPESFIYEWAPVLILIPIYLGGVYVAYKHFIWRSKNMPHLNEQSQIEQDGDVD